MNDYSHIEQNRSARAPTATAKLVFARGRRMGWSGRAPALPPRQAGDGAPKTQEHATSQTLNSKVAVIGIDIGKNSFHIVGQDRRQKWSRGQVEARLAN